MIIGPTEGPCDRTTIREGHSMKRGYYYGRHYRGQSFRNCDLRFARFLDCAFAGCDFEGALLERATFINCDLSLACFEGADLQWTRLLGDCKLPANLELSAPQWLTIGPRARLCCAPLKREFLFSESLPEANLSGADLRFSCLDECNLNGANLSFADIRGASLQNANLRGTSILASDFRKSNLRGTDFGGCKFNRLTKFKGAVYDRTTNWGEITAQGAVELLRDGDYSRMDLSSVFLADADLRYAKFEGANLRMSTLFGCDLANAVLDGSDLRGAVFSRDTLFPEGFDVERSGARRRL